MPVARDPNNSSDDDPTQYGSQAYGSEAYGNEPTRERLQSRALSGPKFFMSGR